MGSGIAQVFAQAGYVVRLSDAVPAALDKARTKIDASLAKFVEKGRLTPTDRDAALAHLSVGSNLDEFADVDFVVEAIAENLEAKTALFKRLDAITKPHAVLSSNTSSISITVLGAATTRPDRVLGMHFMNPVPLMSLVELIRGQATSAESMLTATNICMQLGKTAVEAADYPGVHLQSHPDADDQRGDLCGDGRRRHPGGDRHGDEARNEPPDGTADARRLHRPRRLPGHPRTSCTRDLAIRSTGPVRCCAAWWLRDTSVGRAGAGSTRTEVLAVA